jgi:nicotinamidase-related amidase
VQAPDLAPPVPVSLDPKTTALLVLDVSDVTAKQQPTLDSVPAVKRLLDKARSAGAKVVFALGRAAEQKIYTELEPKADEPVVRSSADKFFNTDLDRRLDGATAAVVVGTAANGAVLYTSFGANERGYTAVVVEDGMSVGETEAFGLTVAKWQLLNQPGFANPDNKPLDPQHVTISRTDLVTFK